MEFDPHNPIVQLCIRGMALEEKGETAEAGKIFSRAMNEATNDLEHFLASYYISRQKTNATDKLKWLETTLQYALNINDDSVKSAFPSLYTAVAECYDKLGDNTTANKYRDVADSYRYTPSDKGPFYHGTKADLNIGDLLTPGNESNYKSDLIMNHIYFTANINGAGLAAALAKGAGRDRVYIVEPTGDFENDPNVTDKKFPGNPTRSYRTGTPLKIVGEATEWTRLTDEQLQQWKEKLANTKGDIIN